MKMYTVPEVARKAGVSEKMVRQAIYDEELEAEKIGPSWVITEEALAEWIEALEDEADDDGDGNDGAEDADESEPE